VLLACGLAFACTVPAPAPNLPGKFVGSFAFSGALLAAGQVGGGANFPETTCLVNLDGGLLNPTQTLSFFAYLSEDPDAGRVWWQLVSNGTPFSSQCPECGPIETGALGPWSLTLGPVSSCVPASGCSCVGSVDETVILWQTLSDGGATGSLLTPVLSLSGWIDDRLNAVASADCQDAGGTGSNVCSADAGLGCGLDCDLVYTLTAVPGEPSF
jgi:hypothetical protein